MTNPAPIKFGTDGWRAVIAADYTFANVERVAQAYADYLKSPKEPSLVKQLVDVGQISKDEAEESCSGECIVKKGGRFCLSTGDHRI